MRKIIGIIFFCFCCCAAAMAQDEPENNDTLSLTYITTRDFMQGNISGSMDWSAVSFGPGDGIPCPCVEDNCPKGIINRVWSGFKWFCSTVWNGFTGLFSGGSPTVLTDNEGGGSGGFIWLPYIPGTNFEPPVNPPAGGNGGSVVGGGTAPPTIIIVNVITPPPIKPATALDNGDMEGGEIKEDSTPVKIDCPPESNTSGDSLTAVLDSIEASPQMTDLRTNLASRKFEVGMSINFNPGNGKYYPYDYINNGQSKNVTLNLAQWTFAIVHTHPLKDSSGKKNTQSPSPLDYFFVTDSWNSYPTHRFKTNYVVAGNGNDYAVTIGDTSNINLFLQNNNPNLLFDESTGTWKGSKTDKKSVYFKFYKYFKSLKEQGYNDEIANEYANIIMATDYNMGIKFYKKINGKFREQKFETVEETGETKYVLIICNN